MNPAAARIVSLYEENALVWDKLRNPASLFEKPWLDRFLALIPSGGSILDLGCGSGLPVADYLIRSGYAVTGVDSAPSMVAMCRKRFPQSDWRVADMRTLALDQRYHGILAWDSFFHLSPNDQTLMFPIFAQHAAPGAALMFTSGPEHGEICGEFQGEPLYHGSLDPAEYRTLLAANGFRVIANIFNDSTCGDHAVWLAQAHSETIQLSTALESRQKTRLHGQTSV
jgi:2-polyprenyl-3-methyl-5-hydroxy-6-metoxy-1,4-benzoquinol methylase